jgi:hypothetical protein
MLRATTVRNIAAQPRHDPCILWCCRYSLQVRADIPIATVMSPVARYGECALIGDAAANRQAAGPSMPATCRAAEHMRVSKMSTQTPISR